MNRREFIKKGVTFSAASLGVLVCEEHCPTHEKAIKFEVRSVKKIDGTTKDVKFPYVDENLCIGYGICVTKCPLEGKAGIFVTNSRQQRWGEYL